MQKLSFVTLILCSLFLYPQENPVQLLSPTGQFPVGTTIFEWTDDSRSIQTSEQQERKRTVVVQFWYPAQTDNKAVKAAYAPMSEDYSSVFTNSYSNASISAQVDRASLILIAPGRGTAGFLYATLAEELASNGYIVAAVDMPEIGTVQYRDGSLIKPSTRFKPPQGMMAGPYEKVDAFFETPTALGTADLNFVLRMITALNTNDPDQRFTGKIDLENIGIFGHSLGGRIAGQFAVDHRAVKAYISMEGIPPREVRYQGKLTIPVAMLCSSGTWPYAKDNYLSLIENRTHPVYMIELPDFGHNSVTDNPFIYPQQFSYGVDAGTGLELSRELLLHYFDSVLRENNRFETTLKAMKAILFTTYK